MSTRPLRAIFFDIDDTLFSTDEFASTARSNSVDAMLRVGLRHDRKALLREFEEVLQEFGSNYEHHFEKLLDRLPPDSYRGINPAILVAAAVVAYHETKFSQLYPFRDVKDVLEQLSTTDVIRGIITAGLKFKQAEKLIRLQLYPYLTPRAIFISDQIGISKPNVKLFQRACDDLDVSPPEAMLIGDNPAHDLDPAKSIGMITVRNRRSGKYRDLEGRTKPDYEIHHFWDLRQILEQDFGLDLRSARG